MKKFISWTKDNSWLIFAICTPLLFAISPSLYSYSKNFMYYSLSELFVSMGIFCGAAIVVFSVVYLVNQILIKKEILKDRIIRTSVITSFFIIFFYILYGPAKQLFVNKFGDGFLYLGILWGNDKVLLPVALILFVFTVHFIKSISKCIKLLKFQNIMIFLIIIFSIIELVNFKGQHVLNNNVDKRGVNHVACNDSLPNIYYIVMDSYASFDVLSKFYSYNNDEFKEFLKSHGFYVAEKSKCNYPITVLSLSSSLNMEYLNIKGQKYNSPVIVSNCISNIRNSLLGRELINNGYNAYFIGHYFFSNITPKFNKKMIHYFQYYSINCLSIDEIKKTPVEFVANKWTAYSKKRFRMNVLLELNQLSNVKDLKQKKFVFAHLYSTHPDYTFNSDGSEVKEFVTIGKKPKTLTNKEYLEQLQTRYINQLRYMTNRITGILDTIVRTDSNAIIVLQSDHGCWFHEGDTLKNKYVNNNINFINQRMPILNAYKVPKSVEKMLYDSISPVNSFRLVLNNVLGRSFPLLPYECNHLNYNNDNE